MVSGSVSVPDAQLAAFPPSHPGVELLLCFSLYGKGFFFVVLWPSPSETCPSPEQSLHDLISVTLMKGSGLLDELDGLSCLLRERERERERETVKCVIL